MKYVRFATQSCLRLGAISSVHYTDLQGFFPYSVTDAPYVFFDAENETEIRICPSPSDFKKMDKNGFDVLYYTPKQSVQPIYVCHWVHRYLYLENSILKVFNVFIFFVDILIEKCLFQYAAILR